MTGMDSRTEGERKAGGSRWLGLAAVLGALAGLTLFPRKAHGPGRPVTPPVPRAKPAIPPG
jgi:hypothetical protein